MKKLFYTLLALTIIFSSCEKEEENNDSNNNNNNGTTSTSIVDVWNLDSVYDWGKASYYINFPSGQVVDEEFFYGWSVSNGSFASNEIEDVFEDLLSQSWEFLQNGQIVVNTVDAVCGYSSNTDFTYSITNNNQFQSNLFDDLVGLNKKFNIDALTPTSLELSYDLDSLTPNFGDYNYTLSHERHFFLKFSRN